MASQAFKVGNGFSIGYFTRLIQQVEPHFSRITASSLSPLLKTLGSLPENYMAFTTQQREQIQDLVAHLPYDKQQKYKNALNHLATTARIKVCGVPVEHGMNLAYFGVGEYAYPAPGAPGGVIRMNPGSYHFVFRVSWKSSTGNMQSLREVGTREFVKFRGSPASPPFNYTQASVPMQFFHGENLTGSHFGEAIDDHSTKLPTLICASPRVQGELVAEQWYQYTLDNGATWKNIPGAAYLLRRGVRFQGNQPVYYFAKSNWPEHNRKVYHFEAEFLINAAPAHMPPAGEKLSVQTGNKAPLENFAWKIVSKGDKYLFNP